jgi:menaquinone-dependent protoporphyrinogen oxidase
VPRESGTCYILDDDVRVRMSDILIAYGTGEGQTAKVANYVADALSERGHVVTPVDVGSRGGSVSVDEFDAVVVGASIHVGKHQREVVSFARANRDLLAARPNAFFQVSLSSASDDPDRQAEAEGYVDEFREETGWHPDLVGGFAGAIQYSKYGFLKRFMMKRIAGDATGDTDTSRDYEYTNWDDVDVFVDAVDTLVETGDVQTIEP